MNIVVGDIGGTNTRLALIEMESASATPVLSALRTFPSPAYDALEQIALEFLADLAERPDAACFGVAGPVVDQQCRATNLPWLIDAGALSSALGITRVSLLNDLEAIAWGIPALTPERLHTLNPGNTPALGNRLVIAAGTGLGQAGLYWDGQRHHPFASEGGHADFAPSNPLEFDLLCHLQAQYGHVSWERVASGLGLVNIYEFLISRDAQTPEWLQQRFEQGDKGAEISAAAMQGEDATCIQALELMIGLLASETGNHALKLMASGGIYLAGGIPPKILDWLKRPLFMERYCDKGRMSDLVSGMPLHVVLDEYCGLYGAAIHAATTLDV